MSNKKLFMTYEYFHPLTHVFGNNKNKMSIISVTVAANSFYIYDCLQIPFKAYFRNNNKSKK